MDEQEGDNSLSFVNAQIASSNGWNEIIFSPRRRLLKNQRKLILSALLIKGDYWDAEKSIAPTSSLDLSTDFIVELKQLLLSEEGLIALMSNLEAWFKSPFSFELNISGSSEDEVWVFVGPRDDLISSVGRPVFSLEYISSRMKGEWSFVTDQSCLSILLEGLRTYLKPPA